MIETNTLLDVANAALMAAGDRFIETLGDKSDKTSMQVASLIRQAVVDVESASANPWRELYKVEALVPRVDVPFCGEWVFNKPTDCLNVVGVCANGTFSELDYREEGREIYVPTRLFHFRPDGNVPAVLCKYTRLSLDPGEWSGDLRGCVIGLLTARLIGVLSANPTASQALEKAFWEGEFQRRTGNRIVCTEGRGEYWKGRHEV